MATARHGVAVVAVVSAALSVLTGTEAQLAGNRDVRGLEGEADFNKIDLHWQYKKIDEDIFRGFKITYCEDQAWGPYRCRNVEFEPSDLTERPLRNGLVEYKGQVSHLRMSTNYTVQVTPIKAPPAPGGEGGRSLQARGRAIPDFDHSAQVFIQTKGFSARAVSCLTNSTLVEVDTGPNFGGKISVEGSMDESCATNGDSKRSTSKYRLNIDHALCGSQIMNDSVRTYVLVQENLPILTHSTRRFMVVCHYIPEAFTVSAGVSLPGENSPDLVPVDQSVNEVDPSELFDSTNTFLNNRRFGRQGKALRLEQEPQPEGSPQMWTQLVLMVVLVVGAVIGLSCAFWHFGRHAGVTAAIKAGLVSRGNRDSDTDSPNPDIVIVSDMLPSLTDSEQFDDMLEDLESPRLDSDSDSSIPDTPLRTDSVSPEVVLSPSGFTSSCTDLKQGSISTAETESGESESLKQGIGETAIKWEKLNETCDSSCDEDKNSMEYILV